MDRDGIRRIGDPHLGRRFLNGVPLHRRSEREQQVWAKFADKMINVPEGIKLVVVYGDLFDKFYVPDNVKLGASAVAHAAAEKNPLVQYVIIGGNHDDSRDATLKSSLEVFEGLVDDLRNFRIVRERPTPLGNDRFGRYLFVPWHPFKNSEQMLEGITEQFDEVFGHWDIQCFGNDTHQLMPYEALSRITKKVSTGHVHKPSVFQMSGMEVTVVGSMLPYAHGEEAVEDQYISITLEQFEAMAPIDYKNKHVRLLLKPNETMPADIDALQVLVKRIDEEGNDDKAEVQLEDFNFRRLFTEVMTDACVSESVQSELWARYEKNREVRTAP